MGIQFCKHYLSNIPWHLSMQFSYFAKFRVYLGVRTCEIFLCFVTIMFILFIILTYLFSLFYATRELDRFLHQG